MFTIRERFFATYCRHNISDVYELVSFPDPRYSIRGLAKGLGTRICTCMSIQVYVMQYAHFF